MITATGQRAEATEARGTVSLAKFNRPEHPRKYGYNPEPRLSAAQLAPHMSEPMLNKALQAAKAIKDGLDRADVLASLTPHLPESLFGEALQAATTIDNDLHRARAPAAFTPYLRNKPQEDALRAFAESSAGRLMRRDVLQYLPNFYPVIACQEGPAGLSEVGRGISETGKWATEQEFAQFEGHAPQGGAHQTLTARRPIGTRDDEVMRQLAL